MLFYSNYILLILFVNLKTVLQPSSKVVKYNIPEPLFQRFNNEFERFKRHSDQAQEFEKNHYNAIKNHILSASDNVEEFIDLLKSTKELLDNYKELKALGKKCNGHYFKAEFVELLNLSREEYLKDQSIGFVGDNVITYTKVNREEVIEKTTGSILVTGGMGWMAAGMLAAGPVGWIMLGAGTVMVAKTVAEVKEAMTTELDKCEFQYWHKLDCLDKCNDVKKEYPFCPTVVLLRVINEMICFLSSDSVVDID